ncbi:hypothetical protein [Flavobacterium daejeonense]|uniref:hypothetical protein n=1 Tax=Flavobacterium daejeonense TaxID=350893 RepID=UPI00068A207C|nr:hypothetical protein [Flavobacterium daejeonense]
MKTISKMLMMVILLIAGFTANAQTAPATDTNLTPMEQYFIGKWKLDVFGLPSGDGVMILTLTKTDGVLGGTIGNEGTAETLKLTKAEIKGNTLAVRFIGGGWDVPMYLDKKDETSLVGSMNDMFDVEGKKIIENK